MIYAVGQFKVFKFDFIVPAKSHSYGKDVFFCHPELLNYSLSIQSEQKQRRRFVNILRKIEVAIIRKSGGYVFSKNTLYETVKLNVWPIIHLTFAVALNFPCQVCVTVETTNNYD